LRKVSTTLLTHPVGQCGGRPRVRIRKAQRGLGSRKARDPRWDGSPGRKRVIAKLIETLDQKDGARGLVTKAKILRASKGTRRQEGPGEVSEDVDEEKNRGKSVTLSSSTGRKLSPG